MAFIPLDFDVALRVEAVLDSRPNMAAKKTSTQILSKADFVRSHANLSPKEIVAKGKADGVKIAESYVYNVRAYDRAKTKSKVTKYARRRVAARKAPAIARPITTKTSAEDLLKAVGAELGLARAIEILQAERARVHTVIRG